MTDTLVSEDGASSFEERNSQFGRLSVVVYSYLTKIKDPKADVSRSSPFLNAPKRLGARTKGQLFNIRAMFIYCLVRSTAQGKRNPTNDCNPESNSWVPQHGERLGKQWERVHFFYTCIKFLTRLPPTFYPKVFQNQISGDM